MSISQTDPAIAAQFLDILFTGQTGQMALAVGAQPYRNSTGSYRHKVWVPTWFAYPDEADQAAREITRAATDTDVYLCPYLMPDKTRAKGAALARVWCHADCDTGQVDLDRVRAIQGAIAIGSGTPGHVHVYVALSEPVNQPQHELLCQWLGEHLGFANAKISDNDVLRPPGTFNFKPTLNGLAPGPVTWEVMP
jgi:hypothetical protein